MIIPVAFRAAKYNNKGELIDPTLDETAFLCWSQTEMNFTIIAATIPIASKFLATLSTHFGAVSTLASQNATMGSSTWRKKNDYLGGSIEMNALQTSASNKSKNTIPSNRPYIRARDDGKFRRTSKWSRM